jgi:DNA-binding MarR family transcriptional regulator
LHRICLAAERGMAEEEITLRYIAKSIKLSESKVKSVSKYLYAQNYIETSLFDSIDDISCCIHISSNRRAEIESLVTQNNVAPSSNLKKNYLKILRFICKATKNVPDKPICLEHIFESIDLLHSEIISILEYLCNQGLIKKSFFLSSLDEPDCCIFITNKGRAEIQNQESKNDMAK